MRAVFGFGRVNPVTRGHARLMERIVELADGVSPPRFYVSRSCDPKRNPLTPEEKVAFMRRAFPSVLVEAKQTLFEATRSMAEAGIEEAVLVVGEDRREEFERRFLPYQGSDALGLLRLSIATIERPAGAVSATAARMLASTGDWGGFRKIIPGDDYLAADLYRAVRLGMGVPDGDDDGAEFRDRCR